MKQTFHRYVETVSPSNHLAIRTWRDARLSVETRGPCSNVRLGIADVTRHIPAAEEYSRMK
jgi:hypothetical protein